MAKEPDDELQRQLEFNRDPITETPGAHPVGTGVGAAAGAVAAGAVAGAFAGPVGAVAGAVAGAVLGGLGGKAAAEAVNPTAEEAYWRDRYMSEPYYQPGRTYDDYGPAYEMGWMGWMTSDGAFDVLQARLANEWELRKDHSGLTWVEARPAAQAAWERVEQTRQPGPEPVTQPVDLVSLLNDLLAHCHDGSYGFTDCAEHTEAPELRSMLVRHAEECRLAALELRSQIKKLGGEPDEGGTASGALHRGWITVRGALTGYTDLQMLRECERAHDAILHGFDEALQMQLPQDVEPVLRELQRHAHRSRDQARAAREEFENRPFLD